LSNFALLQIERGFTDSLNIQTVIDTFEKRSNTKKYLFKYVA